MSALDFPASPTNNQVFVAPNGVTYVWSSAYTAWQAQPLSAGYVGDFFATNVAGQSITSSNVTVTTLTVQVGNSGGWFTPANGQYRPPRGRYMIFAQYKATQSAASHCDVVIRKNGVLIHTNRSTVASSTYYANPIVEALVDSNGSDVFDMQMSGNAGATATDIAFGAFPITPNVNMTQGTGDFMATTSSNLTTTAGTVLVFGTVATGNSGSWYNSSTGRYTPPAGRYAISAHTSGYSSASILQIVYNLRKNGVVVAATADTSPNANGFANCDVFGTFDANGTDYFDVTGHTSSAQAGGQGSWFTAYPISGTKGPQGDAPAGSLMLYSEQVLTVAGGVVAVSVPANAKLIKLDFHVAISPQADAAYYMQGMRGGTPDGSAIYTTMRAYGLTSTTAAADWTPNSANGWLISGGHWQSWGEVTLPNGNRQIGTIMVGNIVGGHIYSGGNRLAYQESIEAPFNPATIDGFRIYSGTNNFGIGSFLRCWAAT